MPVLEHKLLKFPYFSRMSYVSELDWKKELKSIFLIALFGGASFYAWCPNCYNNLSQSYPGFLYSAATWVLLWQGNAHLSDILTRMQPWLENPGKRFIMGIIGVVVYTPLAIYLLYLVSSKVFDIQVDNIVQTMVISVGITFLISFFLNASQFLQNWKQSALEAAELKKEQMATQYESLKNQVNPHFLFNSLNVLTNLVYEDQDQAASFIRQLSKVYRYVLDTRSHELVPLKTELNFLESYIFLQKIRFEDKLKVNIELDGHEESMMPPIALQILMENAIKHNVIAEEEPLNVDLYVEDDTYIVMSNNLQKKNIPKEATTGMGLDNIKARYEFLSQRPVLIEETESMFIVKLPLLKVE